MPTYFRVSPELGDDQHWSLLDTKEQVMDAIVQWFDAWPGGPVPGSEITVQVVEMTKEEADSLPEM
jgi:hypothetical protein